MATTATRPDLGEFFDPDEIAVIAKVGRATVYRLIHNGEIKATRVGGQWRVHETVLRAYLGLDVTADLSAPLTAAA